MNTPARIQRKRSKGWRMPANTVYVGRPSKWGNPWPSPGVTWFTWEQIVAVYRKWIVEQPADSMMGLPPTVEDIRRELCGKNLACWCPIGQPCHADVLLELANGQMGSTP